MNTELEESDSEFWVDYEIKPILKNSSASMRQKNSIIDKLTNIDQKIEGSASNEWIKLVYQEKLERVRESKEAEISSSTIITRNSTKKKYVSTIEALESQYNHNLYKLKQDFVYFKDTLTEKDAYINTLIEILADINLYFTEFSITMIESKKPVDKPPNQDLEIISLAQEIKNLKSQIEYIKEVCAEYQSDTQKANQKADYFQSEYIKMEKNHQDQLLKIEENERLKDIEHENQLNKAKKL
jgi:hypothetical protein